MKDLFRNIILKSINFALQVFHKICDLVRKKPSQKEGFSGYIRFLVLK